jgi:hypothetical protein
MQIQCLATNTQQYESSQRPHEKLQSVEIYGVPFYSFVSDRKYSTTPRECKQN